MQVRQDVFIAVLCANLCALFILLIAYLVRHILGSYLLLVLYALVASEAVRFLRGKVEHFSVTYNFWPPGRAGHGAVKAFIIVSIIVLGIFLSVSIPGMCLRDGRHFLKEMLHFSKAGAADGLPDFLRNNVGVEQFLNSSLHQLNGTIHELEANFSSHPLYPVIHYFANHTSELLNRATEDDLFIDRIWEKLLLLEIDSSHMWATWEAWTSHSDNWNYLMDLLKAYFNEIYACTLGSLFHTAYTIIYYITWIADISFFALFVGYFYSSQPLKALCEFISGLASVLGLVSESLEVDIQDNAHSGSFQKRVYQILSGAVLYPVATAFLRLGFTLVVAFLPELCFWEVIAGLLQLLPLPCRWGYVQHLLVLFIVLAQRWLFGRYPRPLPFPFIVALSAALFTACAQVYAFPWLAAIPWALHLTFEDFMHTNHVISFPACEVISFPACELTIPPGVIGGLRGLFLVLGLKKVLGRVDAGIADAIAKTAADKVPGWVIPMSVALGIEAFGIHAFVICPLIVCIMQLTLDLLRSRPTVQQEPSTTDAAGSGDEPTKPSTQDAPGNGGVNDGRRQNTHDVRASDQHGTLRRGPNDAGARRRDSSRARIMGQDFGMLLRSWSPSSRGHLMDSDGPEQSPSNRGRQ